MDHPLEVTLGDGHALRASGRGTVAMKMKLPNGRTRQCTLHDVLCVSKLAYNLLTVSRATKAGKVTEFTDKTCQIFDADKRLIAIGSSLCYLKHESPSQQANLAEGKSKKNIWHRRFGHLGTQNLQQLASDKMVDGFDLDPTKEADFCESCVEGKHHCSPFPTSRVKCSKQPLKLIHSDENWRSFTQWSRILSDLYTHYTWVYALKHKNQVFECFQQWKALVEKCTGQKVKALRSDNGGEYTSSEFKAYLGIRHELTVPKSPEQNGVSERINRTLVELVRSMLADSRLPNRFWAEALSTVVFL